MITSLDDKILIWPEVFSHEECDRLIARFDWGAHGAERMPELATELAALALPRMPRVPKLEWLSTVTFSSAVVPWHKDPTHEGATHKLCLYLDDSEVGTEFRHTFSLWRGPWRGSVCLFDIDLEHRTAGGDTFLSEADGGYRRVLGLRARRPQSAGLPSAGVSR